MTVVRYTRKNTPQSPSPHTMLAVTKEEALRPNMQNVL